MEFIYLIITVFLGALLKALAIPYFYPLFIVVSIPILYFLIKSFRVYIILELILFFIYDLLFSDTFLLFFMILLLILLIDVYFYKIKDLSFTNFFIIETVNIFLFLLVRYLYLVITNDIFNKSIMFGIYFLPLNILYFSISYYLLLRNLKKKVVINK